MKIHSSQLNSLYNASTLFSNQETLVLQILPEFDGPYMTINDKQARRTITLVYIPNSMNGATISCPLNYFQESCSLSEKWILNDNSRKVPLNFIDNLQTVIVTKKIGQNETILPIPNSYSIRLLEYFKLYISHNSESFIGFDCYALICLLANVKYFPLNPEFEYLDKQPQQGEIVVLADSQKLPDSIKHWALYLGDDLYLSKFGKSGDKTQSLVDIMNLAGMKLLYDCNYKYTAHPKMHVEHWQGFN